MKYLYRVLIFFCIIYFSPIKNSISSEKNNKSVFIPPGFAHGFGTLEKENVVIYSCTKYRHKNSEKGICWNDKSLKIKWGIKNPIISKKDKNNERFKDLF